ncbi:23702_t:CDS:1, partial [Dentiscutata erythropus]
MYEFQFQKTLALRYSDAFFSIVGARNILYEFQFQKTLALRYSDAFFLYTIGIR